MKFKTWVALPGIVFTLIVSGCLYPQGSGTDGSGMPYEEQIQSVQTAVNQFHNDTGVLPIQDFESETSLYERYQIDFRQLIPAYMEQAPASAYENGGNFYYTLIDVEENPEVKVINASVIQEARDLERAIRAYVRTNDYPPLEGAIEPGVFEVDYEQLGYDEAPKVESPYYATRLPMYLDENGDVIIDYASDLNRTLQETSTEPMDEEDIRSILTDEFPVVPVLSKPYKLESGEPVITNKDDKS